MLSESRFLNIHTSELASAVATLELNSSNIKRSKRLFDLSLRSPTENSIAQVAWASRQNRSINLGDEYLDIPQHIRGTFLDLLSAKTDGNRQLRNANYGSLTNRFQVGQVFMVHICLQ